MTNGRTSGSPLSSRRRPCPCCYLTLLRFVHKNAIGNVCNYGQKGGLVVTEVVFTCDKITLRVINLPGPFHQALVQKGNATGKAMFEPDRQLHPVMETAHSSGDGGWIMKKCTKTLGGERRC